MYGPHFSKCHGHWRKAERSVISINLRLTTFKNPSGQWLPRLPGSYATSERESFEGNFKLKTRSVDYLGYNARPHRAIGDFLAGRLHFR